LANTLELSYAPIQLLQLTRNLHRHPSPILEIRFDAINMSHPDHLGKQERAPTIEKGKRF